jgi:hypothetical protein
MKKLLISMAIGSMLLMALPAFADDSNSKSDRAAVNASCVQAAINTRDSAIIAAVTAYSNSWTQALQARQSALNAAWGMSDAKSRRAAINTAWKMYNSAHKTGQETFNTARKNAWSTFKTSAKACKLSPSDDPTNGNTDKQ